MSVKRRLDQILLELGYITEKQLGDALDRQRTRGGKVGAALMFLRHITESQLVDALSIQYDTPGIVLSELQVPDELAQLIPEQMMRSRLAVPFAYKRKRKMIAVAVVDPLQPGLVDELNFVTRGKKVLLHVATEVSVQTVIANILDGVDSTVESKLILQFPDGVLGESGPQSSAAKSKAAELVCDDRVLILTDQKFSSQNVKSVVEREGTAVTTIASQDELVDALEANAYSALYIQDSLAPNRDEVRSLARSHNMRAKVYWFSDCSSWIKEGPQEHPEVNIQGEYDILLKMLLADSFGASGKNEAAVRYVAGTCDRLGIWGSEKQALQLATHMYTVAHTLSLARSGASDGRQRLKAIAEFFESAQSNRAVTSSMLGAYQQVEKSQLSGAVSHEVLAGNIMTALDIAYQWMGERERIRLNEFEDLKQLLNEQTGQWLLPFVTDAMLLAVQERHLDNELDEPSAEVIIYRSSAEDTSSLRELMLLEHAIRWVNALSVGDLVATSTRRKPDLIILALPGDNGSLAAAMETIAAADIDLTTIPTLAICDCVSPPALKDVFDSGVIDAMPMDTRANVLSEKIKAVLERTRNTSDSATAFKGVARGDLENMNLVDLIQAMGPGRKTAEIILEHDSDTLKLYMIEGQIVYAEGCGGVGPEPVYEGVKWQHGSFLVRRVNAEDIPPPNVDVSNDHILMEGCRLMDEGIRD